MRLKLTVVVLIGLALPAVAAAQSSGPQSADKIDAASAWRPSMGLPMPPMGLPLPPTGLPLPPTGLPPLPDAGIRNRSIDGSSRFDGQHRGFGRPGFHSRTSIVYFLPSFGFDYPFPYVPLTATATPGYDPEHQARKQQPAPGRLRLDLRPDRDLQLLVDGYYVGTSEDVNDELDLEPGTHSIQVRAPGYETLEFDVLIVSGRSITYRGMLKAEDLKPAPQSTSQLPAYVKPSGPTTFYVIPGCYAGNVPPNDVKLPATCDERRMITVEQ